LSEVRDRLRAAAERSGRAPEEITLVVVSKGRSVAEIHEAYAAGHRDFGENRAGELEVKAPQLPGDIAWHFIGSLQSRKARHVRPHVRLLHSLDRPKLVDVWAGAPDPPPALIQVNIAAEPQKHGVKPEEVRGLLSYATQAGIRCVGLMTIPPVPPTPDASRRWFVALAQLRAELLLTHPELTELSMGMTDDFEVAIEEGATLIRVGRAIFGPPAVPV